MKARSVVRRVVLAVLVLFAGISAQAKLIPLRPFFFDRGITLNGAEIAPGMYSLSLETQGSSVVAAFWKDGKFVVNAHGTWVKHGVKYTENAVLLRVNADGTRSLVEIRLAGVAKSIVLDDVTTTLHAAPGPDRASSGVANQIPIGN